MKIFSTHEINQIYEFTLRESGITESQFVDTVGESLASEIITSMVPEHRMVMFAGPERCGAYTLSAARHLSMQGYKPTVILFNIGGKRLTAVCKQMLETMRNDCGEESVNEITEMQFAMPDISEDVTVIDGIFGTERTTPLPGGYQSIVRYINENAKRIIAIDVPSGLIVDAVECMISRNIIHANVTLAIGMPRVAFFMRENHELLGTWKVVPVDYSAKAIKTAPWMFRVLERNDIKHVLRPRDPFESKADAGSTILFAGSYGMMGAAVLAARSALRGGCGKVTVHSPRVGYFTMQNSVPCALFDCDPGDVAITEIELKHDYQSVAIGPGLGTADETINALESFLKLANAHSRPLILDADALNCLSIRPDMMNHIPVMSILTPHVGEFDRLFGRQPSSYARLLRAIEVASERQVIIILKGRYTAIIRPDGKVYFNPTGTPALATGGTGDVLTGLLASFMARGMVPEFAAFAAPYVHGLAGELAAQIHGTYGVTASDVVDQIGRAIKSIIE